jgi:alkanesulfonate monooxygenase SsuD/methylene tetrahydromethanopterin reductase-like flavin-dependent oxidoreductase (luciferase family)
MMTAPRPVARPHPPVWVGGNGKLAVRRSVRFAEGWHPFMVRPAEFKQMTAYARELAAQTGRSAPWDATAPVGPVEPAAVSKSAGPGKAATFQKRADEKDPYYVKATTAPVVAQSLSTADQVCEQVRRYLDAGATAINVGFRYEELPPLLEAMEWFMKEVAPEFP